jgi:hypothetical protein
LVSFRSRQVTGCMQHLGPWTAYRRL